MADKSKEGVSLKPEGNAFTLLELVIVVIIVAVLATLALPRMLKVVERTRVMEAMTNIMAIRSAMDRCYLMTSGSYCKCDSFDKIGMEDPASAPNAHFTYSFFGNECPPNSWYSFMIYRNTRDGGTSTNYLYLHVQATSGFLRDQGESILIQGYGDYQDIDLGYHGP